MSCRWRAAMRWKRDLEEHRTLERDILRYQAEILEHEGNALITALGMQLLAAHLAIYRPLDDRIRVRRLANLRRRWIASEAKA